MRCNVTTYPDDHESRLPAGIICIATSVYEWQEIGIPTVYRACNRCLKKVFGPRCAARLLKQEKITSDPDFRGILLPDAE